VICVEISIPPPEFCSSNSRDERNTHWSFYEIDSVQRIPQLINYIISGPFICVQAELPYVIIPAIMSVDQRYYQLTKKKELIPRKIRWKDSKIMWQQCPGIQVGMLSPIKYALMILGST
jgi:hypothetical protein